MTADTAINALSLAHAAAKRDGITGGGLDAFPPTPTPRRPETPMNTADHYTAHNDRVMLCPLCNKTHTVTAQDSAADEDGPVDAESAVVTAHYRLEILARLDAPFKLFAPREKPSAPARAVTTRRRAAR